MKLATKEYTKKYLSEVETSQRGYHASLISSDANRFKYMACMWVDRDRRYFVSTTGTTSADIPYVRERMRTVSSQPVRVEIETPVPNVVRTYYSAASMVDRHNRCRQDDLQIEKSFETKDWSMRVNMTLFGMIVVNSWLLYKGSMGGRQKISQSEFYLRLADGLIDNNYDSARTRQKNKVCEENDANSFG